MVVTRRGTNTDTKTSSTSREEERTVHVSTSEPIIENLNSENNMTEKTVLGITEEAQEAATKSPVFSATPERIALERLTAESEADREQARASLEADLSRPETETRQFRDLLVFEERLRQNAARLKREQQQCEGKLLVVSMHRHHDNSKKDSLFSLFSSYLGRFSDCDGDSRLVCYCTAK
jgi:hypothetical protein